MSEAKPEGVQGVLMPDETQSSPTPATEKNPK